jgi:hypothetical protein
VASVLRLLRFPHRYTNYTYQSELALAYLPNITFPTLHYVLLVVNSTSYSVVYHSLNFSPFQPHEVVRDTCLPAFGPPRRQVPLYSTSLTLKLVRISFGSTITGPRLVFRLRAGTGPHSHMYQRILMPYITAIRILADKSRILNDNRRARHILKYAENLVVFGQSEIVEVGCEADV